MISGKATKLTVFGLIVAAIILALILYFSIGTSGSNVHDDLSDLEKWTYPEERRARGAIASNGGPCASVGMEILEKYGNAVDALIATMLCDGVTCMQNMGIGGGFIATLYIRSERKVITLNARETAPAAATPDMYTTNKSLSLEGGLAVAVPGEIKGYWELHNKYGGPAAWSELFDGTIKLCEEGVPINLHLHNNIQGNKDFIMSMPTLRNMLMNENGELPVFGEKIKLPELARTLKIIAKEGADAFYNGSLTRELVEDIKANGGIITEEDMASYNVHWSEPVRAQLSSGDVVYSVPPPGSGPILTYILKLLDNELSLNDTEADITFKITEAFKFAYGMRSQLGDALFVNDSKVLELMSDDIYIKNVRKKLNVPKTSNVLSYYGSHFVEDHGTANIVVFAPNGDAVSATSTINTIFGSGVVSESTGIILNNEMDDFSTKGLINYFGVPPSTENFIAPGKRPMSSMAPAIVVDKNGEPRLLVGGAGGTRITSATALTILRNVIFNKSVTESVREARFHHQLVPMEWSYEPLVNEEVIDNMKKRGHKVSEAKPNASCITAISIKGGILGVSSDMRRPGNTSFLE